MKRGFYRKIAWSGMVKNRQLYVPFLLTCMGMTGMFYIVSFLCHSPMLGNMTGGTVMQLLLGLGQWVIAAFAVLFLFYSHSFLMRRRKKEFGLYNVLGMGKGNLARVLLWESVLAAGISLAGGLAAGMALAKFAELGMLYLLQARADYVLSVSGEAVWQTARLFGVIFLLLFLNMLRQVRMANPMELLRSEAAGERPPRANWLAAVLGAVILGAAYWLAVSTKEPLEAILLFFAAVLLVIAATYLLFVAGSVVICRLLQKKKNYYYQTRHFVSVSSMAYRMKRNGAGLASICILCTMVLVMLLSTVCLYVGAEDSLRTRYPRHLNLSVKAEELGRLSEKQREELRGLFAGVLAEEGAKAENAMDYVSVSFDGFFEEATGEIVLADASRYALQIDKLASMWQCCLVPIEDYNAMTGRDVALKPGEALLCTTRTEYPGDTLSLSSGQSWQIRERVNDFSLNGGDGALLTSSLYLFIDDFEETVGPLLELVEEDEWALVSLEWIYGVDVDASQEEQVQMAGQIREGLEQRAQEDRAEGIGWHLEGVAEERLEFYSIYGGLFFLGVLLGIVFLFAAVLIMYYKQICEGYEDQARFEILQKVGMTKREIRDSVNSQVLTVFFLPLLAAGMHLLFAFPMVQKLLALFNLVNTGLMIRVALGCYLGFALFYVVVYRITSRAYYGIVSGE